MNKYILDGISLQGYAHILSQKECQDASECWEGKGYAAAIVSDGHGGEKYFRSAYGSKCALYIGRQVFDEFIASLHQDKKLRKKFASSYKARMRILEQLCKAIIHRWSSAVERDVAQYPLEADERFLALTEQDKREVLAEHVKAYGATFLAAITYDGYIIVLKLGDGNVCLVREEGAEFAEKVCTALVDDSLQFNLTTSLCSRDADHAFKYDCIDIKEYPVNGIVLTSDGVLNSYTSEEAYLRLINNIVDSYRDGAAVQQKKEELIDFLNALSQKGSGDDLSVALLLRN